MTEKPLINGMFTETVGNASAGEADDKEPPVERDAARRFVEHVATDRIVDHVRARAIGQLLHLFAKAG